MYELAGSEFEGTTMTCPACGHSGSASSFGASGASLDKSPEELRTPAPSTGAVRSGVPLTPGRGSVSAPGLAGSGGRDIRLARRQVAGPADLIISRDQGTGQAVIRHRAGGTEVARMRRGDDGSWVASVAGRDLPGRTHQRTALLEAVATYNRTAVTPYRPAMPLQGEPAQTPLMAEYGIPAIRMAGDGDGTDDDGLNPRGQAIKKKLLARGFPAARAVAFAHRAQNTRPGQFGQSGGGS